MNEHSLTLAGLVLAALLIRRRVPADELEAAEGRTTSEPPGSGAHRPGGDPSAD